jgi:hypothetical protein
MYPLNKTIGMYCALRNVYLHVFLCILYTVYYVPRKGTSSRLGFVYFSRRVPQKKNKKKNNEVTCNLGVIPFILFFLFLVVFYFLVHSRKGTPVHSIHMLQDIYV